MNTFVGIPTHPLLVHIPAVLLPLAAVGVVLMVIRPVWHQRYRWAVLAIGFLGTVGAVLAAQAGESLAEQVTAVEGQGAAERWQDHISAGESARLFAVVFFAVLVLFVLTPWYIERRRVQGRPIDVPKYVAPVLVVAVLAASAGTVLTVIVAGHSGATSVWCKTMSPPNCDG